MGAIFLTLSGGERGNFSGFGSFIKNNFSKHDQLLNISMELKKRLAPGSKIRILHKKGAKPAPIK
jgi:hypothetical protein